MKSNLSELILAAMFAAVIAILSQFTIPLGAIPLTLQTFAVGLTVTLLGKKVGTLAVGIYLLLGLIGLPVFAGGSAGFAVLFGPTGGFLVGFVFNALVTGWLLERKLLQFAWAMIANIIGAAITLLFGTVWLKLSGNLAWQNALLAGCLPFIIPGIIKACAAGYLGTLISKRLPKKLRVGQG